MSRQKRLARPVAGVDCPDIDPMPLHPRRTKKMDAYGWAVHIGPGCTREKDKRWFRYARSQADCLRLAFGDNWRIDYLGAMPSANDEQVGTVFYLLTYQQVGWRLLVRLPSSRDGHDAWATHPDQRQGRIPAESDAAESAALMEARRTWMADSIKGNTMAVADMATLLTQVATHARKPTFREARNFATKPGELRVPPPAWAWDEQVAESLTAVLVQVWLAERAFTGTDAAAVQTMLALGGPQVLNAYEGDGLDRAC